MNLPNALSFLRLFSVPVFIWLLVQGYRVEAFWLFLLAGLTDALDGYIANRFNLHTVLGAYLDPIADKVLLVAGFITLTLQGHIPLWLTLMVATRDLVIIGGALVYQVVTGSLRMEPLFISKINTSVQIAYLILVLILVAYGWGEPLVGVFVWLTAATTLVSGLQYVVVWSRKAAQQETRGSL